MKLNIIASLSAAIISTTLWASTAKACESGKDCGWAPTPQLKHRAELKPGRHKGIQLASRRHRSGATGVDRGPVVAMIKAQAPSYGVPTWFALRIAKIESGYNPLARGSAGELGVFQLKCATARGIGYRGACSGLLNASTNVNYGLKYLSMAVNSSHGNLRLAASKHNGGLGRRSLVSSYVAMVF